MPKLAERLSVDAAALAPVASIDLAAVRREFPILTERVHGKPLAYLDNAASSQKPECVIAAVSDFYRRSCSNVHRGVHALSERATELYEGARDRVCGFLGAADRSEIVFVRGTTEAINLVAHSYGRARVGPGDEVVVTQMEHHSNIVPWQMLCEARGARLRVVPVDDDGELVLDAYAGMLGEKTRIVAVTHVSNVLGTVNPVREMVAMAHRCGAVALVDGAQAVSHMPVDVRELDCDFYAFSGHKLYGPMGIGVLYGKRALLEGMPPYQGGGDMIRAVTFERTHYNAPPYRFEAGTQDIAGAVGLAAAVGFVERLGLPAIGEHERRLLAAATGALDAVPGLRIVGRPRERAGAISFLLDDVHAHDVGTILDQEGVAVRTGHHCAQPLMARYGLAATVRASFGVYNSPDEVIRLAEAIRSVREVFGR